MNALIDYLENNVNGRTLYTPELTYALEDGALEGVYSDQISFSNLKYSRSGLQWDMFVVSSEKIWEMEGEGRRGPLQKDFSGVSLFRFELARRKSTGDITGFFRFLSASGRDVPAEAVVSGIHDVRLDGDILRLREDQALYRDQPAGGGKYKAVAFQSQHTFSLAGDKLHYAYDGESFDVDTRTLLRRKSADRIPPFLSAER